jgi:transcriptional regulator with GAF, ATPase, and Fis domain
MDEWTTHVIGSGAEILRVPGFQVKVTRGPDKGLILVASSTEVSVGTQEGCDLKLTDTTVSRNHLAIEVRPNGFRLRDLGSTNGTFVSSVRIADGVVPIDTEIVVGESALRLSPRREAMELSLHPGDRFGALIGRSMPMRQFFARLERAASSDGTVLLHGETGTGKDLAAEAIHLASRRASAPFVVVDCASIPSALMESELFGHQRGAFTGAVSARVGAFESADRGTLFLDEIGELPLDLQPKLLRVLEKRTVKPVGGDRSRTVDIRVIAATHRDLRREVNRGTFREDLFFRLSVIPIDVPPLRERGSDRLLLAEAFLRDLAPVGTAMPEMLRERLERHHWPGNVRELRNAVEQVAALGELVSAPSTASSEAALLPFKEAKRRVIEQFERPYLERLLREADGNASAAARTAGLDRVHLLKLLRQHGLR